MLGQGHSFQVYNSGLPDSHYDIDIGHLIYKPFVGNLQVVSPDPTAQLLAQAQTLAAHQAAQQMAAQQVAQQQAYLVGGLPFSPQLPPELMAPVSC